MSSLRGWVKAAAVLGLLGLVLSFGVPGTTDQAGAAPPAAEIVVKYRSGAPRAVSARAVPAMKGATAKRLFTTTEAELEAVVRPPHTPAPDASFVDRYQVVTLAAGTDAQQTVDQLNRQPNVEVAYLRPQGVPAPATPNLVPKQSAFWSVANGGNGANATNLYPGAKGGTGSGFGNGVKVVDLEYTWNLKHEDLINMNVVRHKVGTPNNTADPDHGTSVLGVLGARPNGFGVNGIVPQARFAVANTYADSDYVLDQAILLAGQKTEPGDVILIEQQASPDGSGRYVPVEWWPAFYDAIKYVVGSGRIVVEPAGNGDVNLNTVSGSPMRFPQGKASSGAIVVGAAAPSARACVGDEDALGPVGSRLYFSSYGDRVDVSANGQCVVSTGTGNLYNNGINHNADYQWGFSGTSSASALTAAFAASVSSAYESKWGTPPTPARVRTILRNNYQVTNSTIGSYIDLSKALQAATTRR